MIRKRDSIKAKLQSMQAIVFIPVIIMIGILLYTMEWQNQQYRQSIRNLTMATEFNFDFKSNINNRQFWIFNNLIGIILINHFNLLFSNQRDVLKLDYYNIPLYFIRNSDTNQADLEIYWWGVV